MNVLIAEDHLLTAKLLERMLSARQDINVVGVVSDGMDALEQASKNMVDICIMDISMPKLDGIHTMEEMKKLCPETKVIMLSGHTEKWVIERSLELGASGYITKHADTAEVVEAINKVYHGDSYLDKTSQNAIKITAETGSPAVKLFK